MKWIDAPVWVQTGRNMKSIRKWKAFSQEEIAQKAGIDLKRYKRMERGIVFDITIVEGMNIAQAFEVSYEEIIPILANR